MKILVKTVFWISIFMLFVITAACSGGDSSTNSADSSEGGTAEAADQKLRSNQEDPYVGFALDTLREDRWYRDKDAFEAAVQEQGGQVKTLAANGNQDIQIQQARLLINEGVDVLVVVPTEAEGASEIVSMAHDAGVKVISYDRLIRGADVDHYVSFDNEKVGELQAEAILNQTGEGNVAYVGGAESDNNAVLFREGAMNVLNSRMESGDINLVYDSYTEGWDPETAREDLSSFLNSNDVSLDAVIAANDGTAGGVIEALGNQAGDIPVSGQDAELEAIRRIVEGTQTMTVYKSMEDLAGRAAGIALNMAAGEDIPAETTVENGQGGIPSTLLEPVTVTEENIDETLIESGYLTEEEVYGN
ncbi:sugar ABC transporter substrate-binding protein [Salibacterium qingdaonense]|uniref:Xylose-binding protein n=1 Tax=Salibacterium qingdaonense TaxID=266892 RepID=A0A1I4KLQ2_9BACI|nr:substrate-binding domain-containing protein [Salibacterium qingdaonense]SFL79493.1 xylose-binding protein [Salibacterium qingdaonense]